jgi:NAD(P)-dependent dehydrogenase (short-subunit alcohol dehydrogenase family)
MAEAARTVLVTGASRGLGLGVARLLAGAGYDVIALARQKTKPVTDAIAEAKRANTARCILCRSTSVRSARFRAW